MWDSTLCVYVRLWTLHLISQMSPFSWMLRVLLVLKLGWLGWQAREPPIYLSSTRSISTCYMCLTFFMCSGDWTQVINFAQQLCPPACSLRVLSMECTWNCMKHVDQSVKGTRKPDALRGHKMASSVGCSRQGKYLPLLGNSMKWLLCFKKKKKIIIY